MSEINILNFEQKFEEIKTTLEKARFIAVDVEYSALYPLKNEIPSLFDNTAERYDKLRKNVQHITPLQIGLTAFSCDAQTGNYVGTVYNFYVAHASFAGIEKSFYFQPETLSFLKFHGFDFNKFVYSGIPFMNKSVEKDLRHQLKSGIEDSSSIFSHELRDIYELEIDIDLNKWTSTAKEGDSVHLTNFYKKYAHNYEILYFTQKYIRRQHKYLWTCIENNDFIIKKVSSSELNRLHSCDSLEEHLVSYLLGFSKVYRLLTTLKKPLVGHNLFQDLLLMYESFEDTLPHSYTKLKKIINELFPVIFDTRVIAYDVGRNHIPKEQKWREKGLGSIFEYFKNGTGRHLALNSPAIEEAGTGSYGKFHEAGWDSFCTGYIFIRMAYLLVYKKFPKSKRFVTSELIAAVSQFKNQLNVIRGFNSKIQLDGEDPESIRPPLLVLETLKSRSIDLQQVTSILSTCGFAEVKRLPYAHRRALIVVDNFVSAKKIMSHFENNKEFSIMPYSKFRHSPVTKTLILGSLTISGVLLAWMFKKGL